MAYPLVAIQTAMIALYRGDTTLRGLMSPAIAPTWNVYDQGGSGQSIPIFPYLMVHPIFARTGSTITMGKDAMDVFLQLDVYTKAVGFALARTIAARAYNLLQGPVAGPIVLSGGFTNCLTLLDNHQELVEEHSGEVQHIADRYKMYVQG